MPERWDGFLQYVAEWTPRGSHRKRTPLTKTPPRTLGEARALHIWMWVICPGRRCTVMLAVPLAPLIIRWGKDMALDDVSLRLRCRCGRVGMRMREPSFESGDRKCITEKNRWTGEPYSGPRFGVPEMR